MADFSFDRHAFWAGFRDIVPLAVPGIPFGFVLGVVIAESGLDRFVAWLSSPIVLPARSQLAAIELLAESTGAAVVLVTVAFINSAATSCTPRCYGRRSPTSQHGSRSSVPIS